MRGPPGLCSRGLGRPGELAEVRIYADLPPRPVLNSLSAPHSGRLRAIKAAGCQRPQSIVPARTKGRKRVTLTKMMKNIVQRIPAAQGTVLPAAASRGPGPRAQAARTDHVALAAAKGGRPGSPPGPSPPEASPSILPVARVREGTRGRAPGSAGARAALFSTHRGADTMQRQVLRFKL